MTETSTAATISTPEDFKIGTIGKPFPGCEIRIADDGEILVKGPNVFQGYYKNEEATRETIVDGWLHTGDIGAIDADGFIKITGRKKDIIITAGGKNITPANLEDEIKQHPLVSQCVVVGDRRPYLVALVTLDPEEAVAYAKEHGLPEDPEQLASNPEIAQGDRGPPRQDQREVRPGRAGQEDRDPPPRPLAGERRADADAEGQAGRRRREARGEIEKLYAVEVVGRVVPLTVRSSCRISRVTEPDLRRPPRRTAGAGLRWSARGPGARRSSAPAPPRRPARRRAGPGGRRSRGRGARRSPCSARSPGRGSAVTDSKPCLAI